MPRISIDLQSKQADSTLSDLRKLHEIFKSYNKHAAFQKFSEVLTTSSDDFFQQIP